MFPIFSLSASVPITPISSSVVVVVHHVADYSWSSDLIDKLSSLKQVSCRFMSIYDDLLFAGLKESKAINNRTEAPTNFDGDFMFLDLRQRKDEPHSGIIANVSDLNFQQVFRDPVDCQVFKQGLSDNLNKYAKSFSFYQRVYYSLNQSHRSIFVFSKKFLEDLWPEMSDCKMVSLMKAKESILLYVTPLCSNDQLLTVSRIRNTFDDESNSNFERIRTTSFIEEDDTREEEDINNSTPLLNIPHDCIGDPPLELRDLPLVRVCLRRSERESWWFRKLVAWIVVETSEGSKFSNQEMKNGLVLCSIDTVLFRCYYSKTKLKDKLKKELRMLQLELDKRKLVILPIESLVKEISGNFQVNCTKHLFLHHTPTMCLLFTILFFGCVFPFPYMESAILGWSHATTITTNSYIRGLIIWLAVLIGYLLCIFAINRKRGRRLLKNLGRFNQNLLKKLSIMAGVEKLGFIDLNRRILHFMYYDYAPCVAYLQEHVIKYRSNKRMIHNTQPRSTDGQINSNELQPLDETSDGVLTNTTIQLRTDSLLLEYTGKYACRLASMKLYRPITDRHMSECVCLCQFIEKLVKNRNDCI